MNPTNSQHISPAEPRTFGRQTLANPRTSQTSRKQPKLHVSFVYLIGKPPAGSLELGDAAPKACLRITFRKTGARSIHTWVER